MDTFPIVELTLTAHRKITSCLGLAKSKAAVVFTRPRKQE